MPSRPAVFGGTGKTVLEIKPDSPFVVFYGEPQEEQCAELTGRLVLSNPESTTLKSIQMTLRGTRKTTWLTTNTTSPQPVIQKVYFHVDTLNLFPVDGSKNKAHKVNAGVHEWEFKFKMPSHLYESIEGLPNNYVVYDLKATVDRGYMSKQLMAATHIRVIRTLGRDLTEAMPMDQTNEDLWANKLAYKITVPQKNYIVGTNITANFVLIPLRKGVEISSIKMEVLESRQMFADNYAGRRASHLQELIVVTKEAEMPADCAQVVPDGVEDADALFDESHRFSMALEMPKSLKICRQSADTDYIRITHKLRIYVNLKNPEGHTSQLLVKNHLHLFISPNLPPNEDQSVVVDANILSQQAVQDAVNQHAPPTYGLHQLDELYHDIDPSGFMTPGGQASRANSGANTPYYGHSRSGSVEDLASLNAVAHVDGGASVSALHTRLQDLDMNMSQSNRPTRYAVQRQHSSGGSTPHSNSDDTTHPPPSGYLSNGGEYNMVALSRTPSYNTAVRTPARTPVFADLPTYETATSRPSSPSHTPRSGRSTPSPAHSLDTLTEETQRNTVMNSRRTSPRRHTPRGSDEGR
ncbi:hypothetical protein BDV95DRAFT_595718 [Massariosphaeria phaeospora]|uniref:Arrestin C-terminal-like domain-containing protein n=1 Tax=Massariosphaeria phaeospora TaxID=100035 RepID=A0A7C8I7H8_9PLEO|nr:hypothetical protein BDV95DRAFT_595718 [Massariosphaeria phaeospora]